MHLVLHRSLSIHLSLTHTHALVSLCSIFLSLRREVAWGELLLQFSLLFANAARDYFRTSLLTLHFSTVPGEAGVVFCSILLPRSPIAPIIARICILNCIRRHVCRYLRYPCLWHSTIGFGYDIDSSHPRLICTIDFRNSTFNVLLVVVNLYPIHLLKVPVFHFLSCVWRLTAWYIQQPHGLESRSSL